MGTLLGIARTATRLGVMEEVGAAEIAVQTGIAGDCRGIKRGRQVSVLFRDGWEAACADTGVSLPWTVRRANLYVDGLARPRSTGGRLIIGDVVLEVTMETDPCALMERAQSGLKAALTPDWRGGVCCSVCRGGTVRIGDAVRLELPPR